ncbi:hypothetical protein TcasGA2_TC016168 [Tribolium castaneum]|uniref:Uncharacterized protein n=1 Tax=Tribolium castaneum TaxID=7070 RepID=D6WBI7_TRICA|nr:hypothetical protein TcasGA2_TC016168 [Tribolium castaneum]
MGDKVGSIPGERPLLGQGVFLYYGDAPSPIVVSPGLTGHLPAMAVASNSYNPLGRKTAKAASELRIFIEVFVLVGRPVKASLPIPSAETFPTPRLVQCR